MIAKGSGDKMSSSVLPQIENSIERLPLKDQLSLLEWLVKTIRTQTVFEQQTEEVDAAEKTMPNGAPNLIDGNGTKSSIENEQVAHYNDSASTLQKTVARIKAKRPNPAMIIQPTITVDEVAAIWDADSPTDEDISPDEWDRLWADFEAKQKAADRANDIAEGRP